MGKIIYTRKFHKKRLENIVKKCVEKFSAINIRIIREIATTYYRRHINEYSPQTMDEKIIDEIDSYLKFYKKPIPKYQGADIIELYPKE